MPQFDTSYLFSMVIPHEGSQIGKVEHKSSYVAFDRVPPKLPAPGTCSWKSPAVYACHEFAKSPLQRHPHSKFPSNPFIHVRRWVGEEILLLTFRASNVTTRCARAAERKFFHRTTQCRVKPWCSFGVLSPVRLFAFRWFIKGWKFDPAFGQLFMSVGSHEHCLQCFNPLRLSDLRLNIRTFKGEHLHLSTISTHWHTAYSSTSTMYCRFANTLSEETSSLQKVWPNFCHASALFWWGGNVTPTIKIRVQEVMKEFSDSENYGRREVPFWTFWPYTL